MLEREMEIESISLKLCNRVLKIFIDSSEYCDKLRSDLNNSAPIVNYYNNLVGH